MKEIIRRTCLFSVVLLFFIAQRVAAQADSGKFEYSIGYGSLSSDRLFDGYTGPGFMGGPALKNYSYKAYSGTIFGSFHYMVSRRVSIGVCVAYENESGGWVKNYNEGGHDDDWFITPLGTFKRQVLTIAPEMTFTYIGAHDKLYRLYSCIGIGISYQNEIDAYSDSYYTSQYLNGVNSLGDIEKNNNRYHFNGYYSPIGISIGKKVSGFMELGIGYKGLINGGIKMKL